jgi:hypothetical protein
VLLAEDERGFIAAHQTHKGNPADATLLVDAVNCVIAVTGRPPGTVVGDRGFGTGPDPMNHRRSGHPSANGRPRQPVAVDQPFFRGK